jgi:hypothetical protein
MTDINTSPNQKNWERDIADAEKAVNTKSIVTPRLGEPFKSFPLAIQEILENGGVEAYKTEKLLVASTPTIIKKIAKALDTKKIWLWENNVWTDTGLSELDLAKAYTDQTLSSFIKIGGDINHLYTFTDRDEDPVVAFTKDGNIITPKADLYELADQSADMYQYKDSIETIGQTYDKDLDQHLFDFQDRDGDSVIRFTREGNIEFNERSLLTRTSLNTTESTRSLFSKEFAQDDYVKISLQRLLLTNVSNLSPFIGSFKQNFTIKKPEEFLALKIKQPSSISIDTPYVVKDVLPYSSQVVHPYICEFTKTVHGWRYILVITPFHDTFDQMENPCIYGSNDLQHFELLKGTEQPLALPKPINAYNYNSDPSGIFDHMSGEFVCFYRNTVIDEDDSSIERSTFHTRRTKDFVVWSEVNDVEIDNGDLSPTLVYDTSRKKWVMFAENHGLCYRTADKIEGPWSALTNIATPFQVWHQEVKFCGNHYVGIFNDLQKRANGGEGDIYLGISEDGVNWQFSGSIFSGDFIGPYKPSISHEFIDENNIRFNIVWTSSDRNENFSDRWRLYSIKTQAIKVI